MQRSLIILAIAVFLALALGRAIATRDRSGTYFAEIVDVVDYDAKVIDAIGDSHDDRVAMTLKVESPGFWNGRTRTLILPMTKYIRLRLATTRYVRIRIDREGFARFVE